MSGDSNEVSIHVAKALAAGQAVPLVPLEGDGFVDGVSTHIVKAMADAAFEVNPRRTRYQPHDREWWVTCDAGHEHYGEHGAAGLLAYSARSGRYLIQQRAPWVDHGGTWGIPGGALKANEDPRVGALREAREEGFVPDLAIEYGPPVVMTDDHGGWAFHTVVAVCNSIEVGDARRTGEVTDWELLSKHDLLRKTPWLHPGFAAFLDRHGKDLF